MVSEKDILQTDFEGKKSCKEIPGEKISCTGKKILHRYMSRKNSISRGIGKKILPKPNHPPLQKSNGRPLTVVCFLHPGEIKSEGYAKF